MRGFMNAAFRLGLAVLAITGCGTSGASEDSGADHGGTCTTVGPGPQSKRVHVDATGESARAVLRAISAVLAAQTPPVPASASYALSSLVCSEVSEPGADSGLACTLVMNDGATVTTPPSSTVAEGLDDSLHAAGAAQCVDPHGTFTRLADVTVDDESAHFDDITNYDVALEPNVTFPNAESKAVIQALAAAGFSDCDPSRSVLFVCNTLSGAPGCGYSWSALTNVDGSYNRNVCGPSPSFPGAQLTAPQSLDLWRALIAGAKAANFAPSRGTIEEANVINARGFRWDGTNLRMLLVADNATPPPAPAPSPSP
jgi:hypothetical protein